MLYFEPFGAVDMLPNVHAHLSAFSIPCRSYHAFKSGSLTASSSSCAMMLAIPSAPALPLGPVDCAAQALGQRSGLPTNANLMSEPEIVPWVCQPQYCVQKPVVSLASEERSTKSTVLESLGRL